MLSSSSSPKEETIASEKERLIREQKRTLRKKIRMDLKSLSHSSIVTQSNNVWKRLFSLPEYERAKSVGLFLSMPGGEIRTDEACVRVLKDQKELYVPRVGLDFEHCDMDLLRVASESSRVRKNDDDDGDGTTFYHDWPRNKWGIPEPPPDGEHHVAKPGDIDLLVVPGLCFDRHGGRLGQGKGYYDRFITKMRNNNESTVDVELQKKPLLVAVGLEPSFLNGDDDDGVTTVPVSSHDFLMDTVILPTQTLRVTPK